MKRPAVFFDRDGTLLNERGYLGDPADMRFFRWAAPAIRRVRKAGFRVVIISNQSGLARGYFTRAALRRVTVRFLSVLRKKGAFVDAVYYCPHLPNAGCACRKPKTALGRRAARRLGLDLKRSFVVGDQVRDIKFAHNLGARGVLVMTGFGRSCRAQAARYRPKFTSNAATAAAWIQKQARRIV
jgi:D-glycero-D-manno-heptose 1,7-bisphosphate phosphatase